MKVQRIEMVDDEYIITDEYGAKMVVIPFVFENEEWVQIYVDNDNDDIRSLLEEQDADIHLPLWMFELFGAYVVGNQKQQEKKRGKRNARKQRDDI